MIKGCTEKENKMLDTLVKILNESCNNTNRVYLENDPVVEICNDYYKETFGMECCEIKQKSKHFTVTFNVPDKIETVEYEQKVTDGLVQYEQDEFDFVKERFLI